MTTHYWDFSITGAVVEGLLGGLVLALLAMVAIWATAELVKLVFLRMKAGNGNHLGWKNLPRFFRNRHATN